MNLAWDACSIDNVLDQGITEYTAWRAIDAGAANMMIEQGAALLESPGQLKSAMAGQPVVRIDVPDVYDVGQEFFRWQFATAVAGSVLGINPFNQPDVEASKVATRALTSEYEKSGALPESPDTETITRSNSAAARPITSR